MLAGIDWMKVDEVIAEVLRRVVIHSRIRHEGQLQYASAVCVLYQLFCGRAVS
jgi:hypothetical protein